MILLVDKPLGITSAKAVEKVKRALGVKKAGHAGTLDPLATGLLIVATDTDTKKLTEFLKLPKSYEASILFGKRTTTGDLEGEVIEEAPVGVAESDLRNSLERMDGTLELQVPAYSAIKQGGEALYKKARRGEAVQAPIKPMTVRAAELLSYQSPVAHVRFDVESGAYIRSLVEELGRRLGVPATLAGLRRTSVGDFNIKNAKPLEDIHPARV